MLLCSPIASPSSLYIHSEDATLSHDKTGLITYVPTISHSDTTGNILCPVELYIMKTSILPFQSSDLPKLDPIVRLDRPGTVCPQEICPACTAQQAAESSVTKKRQLELLTCTQVDISYLVRI